jgi:hypothetical protein
MLMKSTTKNRILSLRILSGLLICLTSALALGADNPHQFKADPTKVLGRETCVECHEPMVNAWETTHHFLSFQAGFGGKPPMHRSDEAKSILKKMDLRSAKRGECVVCHYTGQASASGRVRTISGTSCESCHGGAKDWNKVHSDIKNNPNALTDAQALGMIRPHQTYAVAANCFECHTVPNEKLVNTGGHTAGSAFELLAWSQGEVRHNLQASEGKENAIASVERQLEMFVLGKVLDLEYGLRGLAQSKEEGTYHKSMTARITEAQTSVSSLADKSANSALKKIAGLVQNGELKPNNKANLLGVANAIRKEGLALQETGALQKLDSLKSELPAASDYHGEPYQP